MSTRYNDGSHYENHQRAAELRDIGAHASRSADDHLDKQDHLTAHEQSRHAMEHAHDVHAHMQHGTTTFGHKEIAARAHELWVARGCPEGSPEEDWFRAAEELRSHRSE
jgi:Protein of unknown function (DUF2934)